MATSSIFANFDIKDKKTAEDFVEALDRFSNEPIKTIKKEFQEISDFDEIKVLWTKRKK